MSAALLAARGCEDPTLLEPVRLVPQAVREREQISTQLISLKSFTIFALDGVFRRNDGFSDVCRRPFSAVHPPGRSPRNWNFY